MRRFVMALSYPPKIEAVKAGTCGQTVRLLHQGPDPLPADISKRLKHAGDEILLHTWAGKPYRSAWGWQQRYVLSEVREIFHTDDLWRWSPLDALHGDRAGEPIDPVTLRDIARRDDVHPPDIEGLEEVLLRLNGLDSLEGTDWEVLRWPCGPDPAYVPPTPTQSIEEWTPRVIA